MGVMDKFLNYMKLNDNEDEYYDNDFLDDDEADEAPAPKKPFVSKPSANDDYDDEEPAPARRPVSRPVAAPSKVTPMRANPKKGNAAGMEVCVIKPTSFEDAREITETLLKNRTIVMNLEGLDVDVAQRILDFTSGSCYAIDGNLQKISMYIFIITPASVDISGDFQNILGGFDSSTLNTVL
ncbi:MAG: cell division protein SepF [Lachnospiraceae bacterium]|nr:cell division protein SepF [Lachnospiraceae bacterium]MBP5668839.1 cell division protein SepF [Lachnospiraceae bacterium]